VRAARHYLARIDRFAARHDEADLFSAAAGAPPAAMNGGATAASEALATKLAALDPDALSPREAHAALYELKRLAGDAPPGSTS
jgi:DNA mismatch repair protein MutS